MKVVRLRAFQAGVAAELHDVKRTADMCAQDVSRQLGDDKVGGWHLWLYGGCSVLNANRMRCDGTVDDGFARLENMVSNVKRYVAPNYLTRLLNAADKHPTATLVIVAAGVEQHPI